MMPIEKLMCMFLVCLSGVRTAQSQEWAWVYKKKFSAQEIESHTNKKEIVYSQKDIPLCTQLIFSWNAQRPKKGFFTFYLQVKDARTGRWSDWHTMFDWGAHVQRSYQNETSNRISDYKHVRLEMRGNIHADAFRVKVSAQEGALLDGLKGFAVSCADYNKFKSEVGDNGITALPSILIAGVPFYSQYTLDHPRADSLCSPTSYSMLTSFLLKKEINPLRFAQNVYDKGLDIYGSWPFNGAHAFEYCHKKAWFWTIRCNSFADIHAQLIRGVPAIVSVRGPLPGAAGAYNNGHLVVIVGWNQETHEVICHDPAFNNGQQQVCYALKNFLFAWEKSRRLAYYVELRTGVDRG